MLRLRLITGTAVSGGPLRSSTPLINTGKEEQEEQEMAQEEKEVDADAEKEVVVEAEDKEAEAQEEEVEDQVMEEEAVELRFIILCCVLDRCEFGLHSRVRPQA